jgi:hypothetical protein
LQLSIPAEFEQATFAEEYFGRHFAVFQSKLVTGIPWPPGKKEVKFTYTIRNTQTRRCWEQPLDLPCSDVFVRVQGANPSEVVCNLPLSAESKNETGKKNDRGDMGEMLFQSVGKPLPAGYVIRVDMGHLPVMWMAYARWVALAVLIGSVTVASVYVIRRHGKLHTDKAQTHSPQPNLKNHLPKHKPGNRSMSKHGDIHNRRISP